MKKNLISIAIKCSILAVACFGVVMCCCWYPFSISLTVMGTVEATPTTAQNIEMYTQLAFYWMLSVPCFVILGYVWSISNVVKKDNFFSILIAKKIKRCAFILLFALVAFILGNIIFTLLGWNDFAILYSIISILGLVITCVFAVTAHFVSQAAILKEETEGTI